MYVAPGAAFDAAVQSFPTGLTGTVGVQIIDNAGGVTTARVTTGIIESPAGSGVYVTTLTAPTVEGQYTIVWDKGSISPSNMATDELIVTSLVSAAGVPAAAAPAARTPSNYVLFDLVRITGSFAAAPSQLWLHIKNPLGSVATYHWGQSGASIATAGGGQFYKEITADLDNDWWYFWRATGIVQANDDWTFHVKKSHVFNL